MDSEDDIDPQTADVAALKEYVDDRIESVKQNQERQWLDALKAAGFDRETVENSVDRIASHGMTRRAALGVVAASVFGAGVFTGQASAAPGDDGDTVWGSDTNRSDWYADEIDANKVVATESQYESVADDYHYAGSFDGADADARLDAALSEASSGDTIYLENDDYTTNRTISTTLLHIIQAGAHIGDKLGAEWTLQGAINITNLGSDGNGKIIVENNFCQIIGSDDLTIQVNNPDFIATNLSRSDVTFASGTTDGVVDASASTTVTDNGTNSIGDVT